MIRYCSLLLILLCFTSSEAQQPKHITSGMIYEDIEKLGVLANILFVAAHPDDENTRMISYLANDVKADTRYLSLTRGDGGQNLIGPEIKELLGVIRTQELLAARRIDGGSQVFSRANDFGYSKNAEETIAIWDDEKVLSDVVWAIRTFRPDVIINRFDHESSGKTHGHHTASAMLSYQAFDLSDDQTVFPEQLKYTEVWQPRRLFHNTSWWFYGSREKFEAVDKSDMMSVDIGTYYPQLGISNNEMAAYSRSMHKCQGMGNTPARGSQMEYLKLLKGDMPKGKTDLLEGIDVSWSRVKGGEAVKPILQSIIKNYDFSDPSASIPDLLKLRKKINSLPDGYWKSKKLKELDDIIVAAAGIFIETKTAKNLYIAGSPISFDTEVVSRSYDHVSLKSMYISGVNIDTTLSGSLTKNEKVLLENKGLIPSDMESTSPYWLKEKGSLGMYHVSDQELIGNPETSRAMMATYEIAIDNQVITINKDVIYKFTDPERGEVYTPVEIVKPFYVDIQDKVVVYSSNSAKTIKVSVKGMVPNSAGLNLPKGWTSVPTSHQVSISQEGEEQVVSFEVTPPSKASQITIHPSITSDGKKYTDALIKIDYHHIPLQYVALPAESRLVKLDIKTYDQKILYVEGAGDEIPASLRQINYEVDVIAPEEISADLLAGYDVVILGIRAYNKSDELKYKQPVLFDFVEKGGNMIVQYTTTWRKKVDQIGPYPMQLSRDRVSVEEAPVRILALEHPIVNHPNKITQEDFEGWVQERGLYFADEWDDKYTPILSSNDPGETPKDGGMLVAPYGKGNFIYSGYSWFRELPAGVPGAYRLFANMISLGKE